MIFKKIGVCYGPSCTTTGAQKIQKILEQTYGDDDVEIVARTCCGRCKRTNSIVIDDEIIVSDLSPKNIQRNFIADPQSAIEKAKKEKSESDEKLDSMLSDGLLL